MLTIFKPTSLAIAALTLAASATLVTSCKKSDDSVGALTVSAITASGRDLNGAAVPQDVPVASTIVIHFNKAVNATTATPANIMLMDPKNNAVATAVTAAGDSATIDPTADLTLGTTYTLNIGTGVKGSDGAVLGTAVTRQFKVYGAPNVDPPKVGSMTAYWSFNNSVNATVGSFPVTYSKNTFGMDRFGFENSAAYFNGVDDIIEVAGARGLIAPATTISFWAKFDTINSPQGDFVMGMNLSRGFGFEFFGNLTGMKETGSFSTAVDTVQDDLFINEEGKDGTNGGWQGWEFGRPTPAGMKTIFKDKWVHVLTTYEVSSKRWTLYLNGVKYKVVKWDLWPAASTQLTVTGYAPRKGYTFSEKMAFGFGEARDSRYESTTYLDFTNPNNNHFKGWLDDVRFLSTTFTDQDALELYNGERPQ